MEKQRRSLVTDNFYGAPKGEPKALSKGGLGQYVDWTRLLSVNRIQSRLP